MIIRKMCLILIILIITILLLVVPKEDNNEKYDHLIPLTAISVDQQTRVRSKILELNYIAQNGEDISDTEGQFDPEAVVLLSHDIENFSAETPLSETGSSKMFKQQYYSDPSDYKEVLIGGGITSNWWIGERFRYGLLPPGRWKRWNGKYMYLSNYTTSGMAL